MGGMGLLIKKTKIENHIITFDLCSGAVGQVGVLNIGGIALSIDLKLSVM